MSTLRLKRQNGAKPSALPKGTQPKTLTVGTTPRGGIADFGVFIGRFRFFHNGHLRCVRRGLEIAKHLVILVGSSKQARSQRNPLRWEEVRDCIMAALPEADRPRVTIIPLLDRYNDVVWMQDVQAAVAGVVAQHHRPADGSEPRICLVGHSKDASSYYLRMFPQWDAIEVPNGDNLSATPMREDYFADAEAALTKWGSSMPPNVVAFLRDFAKTDAYRQLSDEAAYIRKYKEAWKAAPYPPTFVTADAVVVQSGHILLIERRSMPGKGLLALPGGFIGQDERIKDAVIRELVEETRLKVPRGFLEGSIKAERVFDDPHRSSRGRTITTAFLIELKATDEGLPKVRGGDDAAKAFWLPISEIDPERMFEDHYHIIQTMLGYASR